jgi:predicted PurR-regulated permease PerM
LAARKLVVSTYLQYVIIALGALLLFTFLRQISGVLLTFLFAGVLAYALNPLVRMLERRRVPRVVAVLGSFLTLVVIVSVLVLALVLPAVDQVIGILQNPQAIADAVTGLLDGLRNWAVGLPYVGDPLDEQLDELQPQALAQLAQQGAPSPGTVINATTGIVGSVIGLLFNLVLAVIIAVYLLIDRERIGRGTMRAVPEAVREQAVELFHVVEGSLVKYIRAQALLCLIMGVIGWAIMQFTVGSQFAITVGLLVGFTELIPVIGAYLGAVPAVVLALVSGGFTEALIVAALFLVAQQLEGNILVPRIQGESVGVHPLWVLFAVSAATALYGLVGAIFAVPIVAIIAATFRYLSATLVFERWRKAPVAPLSPGEKEPPSIGRAALGGEERPGEGKASGGAGEGERVPRRVPERPPEGAS